MEKTQITKQKLFLTNLLAGQYDETTIESAANEYNMTFEYENYIACVLYFHGNLEKGLTNSIMLYLKEYFDRNDMQCYPISQTNPHCIFFVFILKSS